MELLTNPVRAYAWGSRTVIAELLGRPVPSPHPEAELWLGAHPGDPSHLATGKSLVSRRSRPTRRASWAPTAPAAGGQTLPFLLKVLAADEPLSPAGAPERRRRRARVRRARRRAGMPRDAADRNYRDANHKPELICALTAFARARAASGRPPTPSSCCARSTCPAARPYVGLLAGQPDARRPAGAVHHAGSRCRQSTLTRCCPRCSTACVRLARRGGEFGARGAHGAGAGASATPATRACSPRCCSTGSPCSPARRCTCPRATCTPTCPGSGVELMANSDNVLRGGLTPKHVDVPELLRVLDFDPRPPPVLPRRPRPTAWVALRHARRGVPAAPAGRRRRPTVPVPDGGPRILLCTAGAAVVRGARHRARAGQAGPAVWLAASDAGATVEPRSAGTQLFLAGDGLS